MADAFAAPPIVYALSLVPALLWGFAPVLSKRGMAAGGGPVQAALVVVAVDSALYWAILTFRYGTDPFPGLTLRTLGLFVVAGVVGTALGRIAVFAGVDRVGASVNSAIISARPLFATMLAIWLLGERVAPSTVAGVLVLTVGLGVLALAKGGDVGGWQRRDLLFPLAAAVSFGFGNVVRRSGFKRSATTALEAVTINETAALVALGAYVLVSGRSTGDGDAGGGVLDAPPRSYAYFAGSGTLTAVALASMFAALGHPAGRVAVVDPLAATAPLFTPVFAYFLLGDLERVTRGVVAGAALIVMGVALVTAGPAVVPAIGAFLA